MLDALVGVIGLIALLVLCVVLIGTAADFFGWIFSRRWLPAASVFVALWFILISAGMGWQEAGVFVGLIVAIPVTFALMLIMLLLAVANLPPVKRRWPNLMHRRRAKPRT